MYQDPSIRPEDVSIPSTLEKAFADIRKGFLKHKGNFAALALIFTITGLFLNVSADSFFLRRVQTLFLGISISVIIWLIVSVSLTYFRGRHVELYHGAAIMFLWAAGLLIFNLGGFIFTDFTEEVLYYLHWLGAPFIALALNLVSIYFFRLVKRFKTIDFEQLQYFFLVILNGHLTQTYFYNEMRVIETLKSLITINFSNLFVLYIFLVIFYVEFYFEQHMMRLQSVCTSKRCALSLVILVAFVGVILPFLLNFAIFPMLYGVSLF